MPATFGTVVTVGGACERLTMSMSYTDVAIVGGGPTGLALACALGADSVSTVLVDRTDLAGATHAVEDPRVTAVALGSARFLQSVGCWTDMAPSAEPILDIRVQEGRSSFAVHYSHSDVGAEPMGWIVDNSAINAAMLARARQLPAVQLWGCATYTQVTTDEAGATLTFDDGRTLRARLLVAADGKFSRLRDRLGILANYTDYRQSGIVATLGHSIPHRGLATEHFFPDGPFAVLPMRGDRSSIVWALETDLATSLRRLPVADFVAEVSDRVGDRLGRIEVQSSVRTFPLVLAKVDRLTARRAVLVGDAAHGIHPIAGQGWNLALRDVAALAELVADASKLGLDPGSPRLLARYEQWRRFDTTALIGITDGINRLFANDVLPLRVARNLGFALVDRLPVAKRFFMRHAMGVIGDLPLRMQPQAGVEP